MFWSVTDSLRILCVPPLLLFAYYSGVLFDDSDRSTQRDQQKGALEFVVFTLGAFLRTDCHGITMQYHGGCIQPESEARRTLAPLNKRIWTILAEYGTVRLLSCIDEDPIQGLFALS